MSKIKRIIEIDSELIEKIKNSLPEWGARYVAVWDATIRDAIKDSKPYDDSGDLISREALKEEVRKHAEYYADRTEEDRYNTGYTECACEILDFIDNAPTIEPRIEYGTDGQPYKLSMTNGKEYERPQVEKEPVFKSVPTYRKYEDYHDAEQYVRGWNDAMRYIFGIEDK